MKSSRCNAAEWVFPAALEEVDLVCTAILACLSDCEEQDRFAVHLLARESLNNAVLHGSLSNPQLSIHCEFRREQTRVTLCVRDEGPGFDWRAVLNRSGASQHDVEGRGVMLYRLYASRVEFNPAGNSVKLVRELTARSTQSEKA